MVIWPHHFILGNLFWNQRRQMEQKRGPIAYQRDTWNPLLNPQGKILNKIREAEKPTWRNRRAQ